MALDLKKIKERADKALEERKEMLGGDYPPWWDPEEEGEKIFGEVLVVRPNPWDSDHNLYNIQDENGNTWTLRPQKVLIRELESQHVKAGDIVEIEYMGFRKSGQTGFRYHQYAVAVIPKEELKSTKKEKNRETKGPSPFRKKDLENGVRFLTEMLDFYGGTVQKEVAEKFLAETKGIKVSIEEVVDHGPFREKDGTITKDNK